METYPTVFEHAYFNVIRNFFPLLTAGQTVLTGLTIVVIIYVLYKSYVNPVLIVRDLNDVGESNAASRLRGQVARRLGTKLPPPYPNGWFAVVESRDLSIGDVKSVDVLGQNLCVFRDESGTVHILDAYCPHLGANMGVGGRLVGGCLQCPFHKWRFDSSGRCVSVPGLETAPRGVGVRRWAACERAGAVWVWYDAGDCQPSWQLPTDTDILPDGWQYRGRNEYIVSSHIQDIPENGADVSHLNSVHSTSLVTQIGEKYPLLLHLIGRHVWTAEWRGGENHSAHMKLQHRYKIGKFSLLRVDIQATQVGPGAVFLPASTCFGPLLVCQSVTPLSPCEQKVVHRIFSPWYNAPLAAAFVYLEAAMFERDVMIWNSKRYVSSPAYVKGDRSIRAFRAWYSQFYSESSISFQQAMRRQADPMEW